MIKNEDLLDKTGEELNEAEHEIVVNEEDKRNEDSNQELSRKRQASDSNESVIELSMEPSTSRRRLSSGSDSITVLRVVNNSSNPETNPQDATSPQSTSIGKWLKPLDLTHLKSHFRESCNGSVKTKHFDDEVLVKWKLNSYFNLHYGIYTTEFTLRNLHFGIYTIGIYTSEFTPYRNLHYRNLPLKQSVVLGKNSVPHPISILKLNTVDSLSYPTEGTGKNLDK